MPKETLSEGSIKQLITLLGKSRQPARNLDISLGGRELISNLASWAGKGKDEIVQLICREIGSATAAVLKEPLTQVIESRKLTITLELVPKKEEKKITTRKSKAKKK